MNLDGTYENFDSVAQDFDSETSNNFSGAPSKTPRKDSFDLNFTNLSGEALTIELFAGLYSFLQRSRPELVTSATVLMIPQLSLQGLAAAGSGIVGLDRDGNLVLTGAAAAVALTVKCNQLSYGSLLEASSKGIPFKIIAVRMTVQTDAQIDNEIVHFTKSFLGSSSRNSVNPRTSFRPDQFQGKIVDVPLGINIDGQKGIEYKINANETVKWNVIIER